MPERVLKPNFEFSTPMTAEAHANLQNAFDKIQPKTWAVEYWVGGGGKRAGSYSSRTGRSIRSRDDRAPELLKQETKIDILWWQKSDTGGGGGEEDRW